MTSNAAEVGSTWREKIRVIIFEADTQAGKAFDVALLIAIVVSVLAVILESVAAIQSKHARALDGIELTFTLLFTIEYALRLISVPRPGQYAKSFFGIVDLLAILPTYMSILVPGAESLIVIRGLRLLRVFRIFKLAQFLGEASVLRTALMGSRRKVTVFLGTILILVTILGAAMYLVEGADHGFTSIPVAIYWSIITMTTVGYGDLTPQTVMGKTLAGVVMILGYSIIAIPTGIITAEIVETVAARRPITTRCCSDCMSEGHAPSARFCKDCGVPLEAYSTDR